MTTERRELLDHIANDLVAVVSESRVPIRTRTALGLTANRLSISEAQAKYGLTHAKSVGLLVLDPETLTLREAGK